MEMKPLQMIEQLKLDKKKLEQENKFLGTLRAEDHQTITSLRFELETLKNELKSARKKIRELQSQVAENAQFDTVDLDSGNEMEVPQLVELPSVGQQPQSKSYQCEYCDKIYVRANHFRSHMKTHEIPSSIPSGRSDVYQCEECQNFSTHSLSAFRRHVKRHRQQPILCPIPGCTYKSVYTKRVASHMMKTHPEQFANFQQMFDPPSEMAF